jgi:hypothetical protein
MSTLITWLRYKYFTLLESVPDDIMHSSSLLNSTIVNPHFSELQLIQKNLKESNFHTSFPNYIFKIWTWNTNSAWYILMSYISHKVQFIYSQWEKYYQYTT